MIELPANPADGDEVIVVGAGVVRAPATESWILEIADALPRDSNGRLAPLSDAQQQQAAEIVAIMQSDAPAPPEMIRLYGSQERWRAAGIKPA